MSKHYLLNKDHTIKVVDDVLEWGREFETLDRVVKQEELENGYKVSTVFLGVDYNFAPTGEPILFESMVFKINDKDRGRNYDMNRYHTWDEAVAGHKKMVRKWEAK